jgi:hypothetical protein
MNFEGLTPLLPLVHITFRAIWTSFLQLLLGLKTALLNVLQTMFDLLSDIDVVLDVLE